MRRLSGFKESAVGNKEPLKDVLAEKGLHFIDNDAIPGKLKELGKGELVGKIKALIEMVDSAEGETSYWVCKTDNPSMNDTIMRIK